MNQPPVSLSRGDLPVAALETSRRFGRACLDIETSGLDWKEESIATVQVFVPDGPVHLVQLSGRCPANLSKLVEDEQVLKIFHHAMFDLRFLVHDWKVTPRRIACTKISSKILDPDEKNHSLRDLLRRHLSVEIDKAERCSNWHSENLTRSQIQYAANDVFYLDRLYAVLRDLLERADRWPLAEASFEYLPHRVQLDLLDVSDVFLY